MATPEVEDPLVRFCPYCGSENLRPSNLGLRHCNNCRMVFLEPHYARRMRGQNKKVLLRKEKLKDE